MLWTGHAPLVIGKSLIFKVISPADRGMIWIGFPFFYAEKLYTVAKNLEEFGPEFFRAEEFVTAKSSVPTAKPLNIPALQQMLSHSTTTGATPASAIPRKPELREAARRAEVTIQNSKGINPSQRAAAVRNLELVRNSPSEKSAILRLREFCTEYKDEAGMVAAVAALLSLL